MWRLKFLSFLVVIGLISSAIVVAEINHDSSTMIVVTNFANMNDDFYFVQLTDTHVKNILFDITEESKGRLDAVIEKILSFENPPAFIVITGDLTEWGSEPLGHLNCQTFVDCFYKNSDQLYADSELTIPVYTTPGNHDYMYARNLDNYYNYIKNANHYTINYNDMSLFFREHTITGFFK